jgi:hypothetical protein
MANSAQGQADFYRDKRGQRCRSCTAILTGRTFGGHCARCYQRAKTWGDPGQRPIKLQELRKEWLPRVLQLRALAPKVDWVAIGERWQIIVDRAHVKIGETYTSSRELGQNRWEKAAAAVLVEMAKAWTPRRRSTSSPLHTSSRTRAPAPIDPTRLCGP